MVTDDARTRITALLDTAESLESTIASKVEALRTHEERLDDLKAHYLLPLMEQGADGPINGKNETVRQYQASELLGNHEPYQALYRETRELRVSLAHMRADLTHTERMIRLEMELLRLETARITAGMV